MSHQQLYQQNFEAIPVLELEAIRLKLVNITRSLRRLRDELIRSSTSEHITVASIQNQYTVLITQFQALSAELLNNAELLNTRNVFPIPKFPVQTQELLLTVLLRKRPAPESEEWIQQAETMINDMHLAGADIDESFVDYCLDIMDREKENHNFFGVFTQQEIDEGLNKANDQFKIDRRNNDSLNDKPSIGLNVGQALKFMHCGSL